MQLISKIISIPYPPPSLKIRDILPGTSQTQPEGRQKRRKNDLEYATAQKTFVVSLDVANALNMTRAILDTPGNRFVQMGNRQIICLSRLGHSDETIELILSFGTDTTYNTEIDIRSSKTLSNEMAAHAFKLIDSLYGMIRRSERRILAYQSAVSWLVSVADNTESEPSVLEEVSNYPDARVKAAVADNPNAPLAVLFKLANDSDTSIRYQLADNHNAATQVLEKLANDRDAHVAQRAKRTLSNLAALTPKTTLSSNL